MRAETINTQVTMKQYSLNEITALLGQPVRVVGTPANTVILSVKPVFEATPDSLTWINPTRKDKQELAHKTAASYVICDESVRITEESKAGKCFLVVSRPDLAFLRVMASFDQQKAAKPDIRIHPTAIINSEATIDARATIGPYCIIGRCSIGAETEVGPFTVIHDDVQIGSNVIIHEHCVIGDIGFGFIRNEHGQLEKMPHVGKVFIEDDVELLPFVNVDRGTLTETRIKRGAKIDHYCHIGHNSLVAEDALVTACVVMCGGSKIGSRTTVGVGSLIKDSVKVGDDVFIGLGAVVTKDVPDGQTWIGIPARPLQEFVRMNNKLADLAREQKKERS